MQTQGQPCHWCRVSHWNTQLPILMSWVRPDREIIPRHSTQTSIRSPLWCCYGGSQSINHDQVITGVHFQDRIKVEYNSKPTAHTIVFFWGGDNWQKLYFLIRSLSPILCHLKIQTRTSSTYFKALILSNLNKSELEFSDDYDYD